MNEHLNEPLFDHLASPSFEGINGPSNFLVVNTLDDSDDMVAGGHLTELGALVFSDDPTALEGEFQAEHLATCDACQQAVGAARLTVNTTSSANKSLVVPSFPGVDTPGASNVTSLDGARLRRATGIPARQRNLRWLGVAAGVIGFTALGGSLLNRNSSTNNATADLAVETRAFPRAAQKSSSEASPERGDSSFAAETSVAAAATEGELEQAAAAETTSAPIAAAAAPDVLGDVPLATTALPATAATEDGSGIIREANEPTAPKPAAAKRPAPPPGTVPGAAATTLLPNNDTASIVASPQAPADADAPPPTFARSFTTITELLTQLTQQPQLFKTLAQTHPCSEVLQSAFGFVSPAEIRFVEIFIDGVPVVIGIAPPDVSTTSASPTTTLLGNWRIRLATPTCQLLPNP